MAERPPTASTTVSRRDLLSRSAAVGAGVLLAGTTEMLTTEPAAAWSGAPGYGPLLADPAGRLDLPRGFRYTIVAESGVTRLETGELTPGRPDGTASFARPAGGFTLVNNHEIFLPRSAGVPEASSPWPVPHAPGHVYDPGAEGGCTVIETDAQGNRIREYVGIAGTAGNCSGGVTPWQTWITCEEMVLAPGENGATKPHGYCFEVDPHDRVANRDPRPIKALGRFTHETVAVDPARGHLYLTEDATGPNGLWYRWTPPAGYRGGRGGLRELGDTAGTLAAMVATDASGKHVDDLSRATTIGTRYAVRWVTVPDRDARHKPTRRQLRDREVTRAHKLEGSSWADGGVYVVSSFGRDESPGTPHDGQVWFYDPVRSTLTLRLRFGVNPRPGDEGSLDGPDNITVSPYGGVVIAEDGEGLQHLIGVTEDGATYPIARTAAETELIGPHFSADGTILFAGEQRAQGTMFAITGPWR